MNEQKITFTFYETEPGLWKCRFPMTEDLPDVSLNVMRAFFHDFSEALNDEPEPKPGLEEVSLRRN